MIPPANFDRLVGILEGTPELRGRTVAQVPFMAEWRLDFRRKAYLWSNFGFGMTVFCAIVSLSPENPLWWLSALAAVVNVGTLLFCEHHARAMSRQLQRRAAVQAARDIFEMRG